MKIYSANFNSTEPFLKNQILLQLNITKILVKNTLKDLIVEMKDFKFQTTLQVTFHKERENSQTKLLMT